MARIRSMFDWNWLKANDAFKRCRVKSAGALVAKNTYIKVWGRDAGGEPIYSGTYCGTTLVKWYPNGRIDVTSKGWTTMTTKRRLYQFARVSMERLKGHDILRDTSGHSRTAVVDNGEWFTLRTDDCEWGIRPVDGPLTLGTIHPMRPPSTAKRDPMKKLCRGDVLVSPEGQNYICQVGREGRILVPYYGDPARGLMRATWDNYIRLSPLLELSLEASGWKAGKRFTCAA
jgi:hypothetical protein